jgi:hypothetical protein
MDDDQESPKRRGRPLSRNRQHNGAQPDHRQTMDSNANASTAILRTKTLRTKTLDLSKPMAVGIALMGIPESIARSAKAGPAPAPPVMRDLSNIFSPIFSSRAKFFKFNKITTE